MLETLNNIDVNLFRWVNGHHNTVLDWTMWSFSQKWFWLVVIVLFVGLVTMRKDRRRWWLVLAGIGLCFLLADQTSVHLFKDTVCRLRPCHALDDVRMFRTRCGGQYGFISSHAANAFALTTFLWLRYRGTARTATILMILWAVATCYSRAYLGKHYPGDLICGALWGALMGLIVWQVVKYVEKKLQKSET